MSTSAEQLAQAGQSAAAYIEKKWGVPTKASPFTSVALDGVNASRILLNNPRRFLALLSNPSTANVFWGTSKADASSGAIAIPPLGGSITLLIDEDGELTTYEQWLFSLSAVTVFAMEVFRK